MYKLVVSDFDKTLINDDGEIPISTIILFDELRRNGVKIAIATGRCLKSVLDYNKDVTFCDYLITSNGAYIYDVENDKILYKKNISINSIKKIVKKFFMDSIIYLTDHYNWNLIGDKSIYENDFDVNKINDYEAFLDENKTNIYKLEIYFKTLSKAKNCLKELSEMNLNVKANLQINSNKYIVEVTNYMVDKLQGVKKVSSKLKIDLSDVIAFGDGYNDIELLENVGCSVAVDNAISDVKKVVNSKTSSNNLKGVEKYLEKIYK